MTVVASALLADPAQGAEVEPPPVEEMLVVQMAMAHVAATLTNFSSCEHHAADMPWWQDLVRAAFLRPFWEGPLVF